MSTVVETSFERSENVPFAPDELERHIREYAAAKQENERIANAFLLVPGELALHEIAQSRHGPSQDRLAALELLQQLTAQRQAAIVRLPALEDEQGNYSGVTVSERFVAFVADSRFGKLDLGRVAQAGWKDADRLQVQLNELFETLPKDRFSYKIHEISPETCGMYTGVFKPEMLQQGILYIGRNRSVATIYDQEYQEEIALFKDSGFKLTLASLNPLESSAFFKTLARRFVEEDQMSTRLDLENGLYTRAQNLITGRHGAVTPLHAALSVKRRSTKVARFSPSPLLDNYPHLQAGRLEQQAL